jgi:hypothetical protein
LKKAGGFAGFFVAAPDGLLPLAASFQLSVDGLNTALEIDSRSSYVPSLPLGA